MREIQRKKEKEIETGRVVGKCYREENRKEREREGKKGEERWSNIDMQTG